MRAGNWEVIGVAIYLLLLLVGLTFAVYLNANEGWLPNHPEMQLALRCAMAGGYGGLIYCLRGIYLNVSVRKDWDRTWLTWYAIRPVVSLVVGGVSYLFMRAGLFVLESTRQPNSSDVGFLALAFIAGLNVDRFLSKLEDVAKAAWGIRPSRTGEASDSSESK